MSTARWPLVAVCGKFQPFHNDHLKYVLAGFEHGDHVIIGVTNPDPWYTRPEDADQTRGQPASNPLTYYERHLMVRESLRESQVGDDRYEIVPFPINVPASWFYYVPREATFLLTLYDDDRWLEVRRQKLEEHGATTHVLWSSSEKAISGVDVRNRIVSGDSWEQLVPPSVARIIDERRIAERIRHLRANPDAGFYQP